MSVGESVVAMRRHLHKAVSELQKAKGETRCGWCHKNIDRTSDAVKGIAELSEVTGKTADIVQSKTEREIKELGGKVGVLRRVVREERGHKGRITRENLNTLDSDAHGRGISVVSKQTATYIVGGSLALGTGLGFAFNRLDEQFQPLGTQWYAKLGQYLNLGLGATLMLLGMSKKVKKDSHQYMLVAGGSAMMANGALQIFEGMYKQMVTPPAGAYRMNLPRPMARPMPYAGNKPIGVIPPKQVWVESY